MFLLHPSVFTWDLAILILLSFSLCGLTACIVYTKRTHPKGWRRLFLFLLCILCFFCFLTVAYGSFVEPQILVITKGEVRMPLQEPLRALLLSDFELGPYKGKRFLQRIVEKANALHPDLVLITGDFLIIDRINIREELTPLSDLRPRLGTFAVLGNHDAGHYLSPFLRTAMLSDDHREELEETLKKLGVTVLRNEHALVTLKEGKLAIAGIEDLWTGEGDVKEALQGIPEGMPTILLSHNPDAILEEGGTGAHLVATGHTHGGQIRLPYIGALHPLPTKLGSTYDQGLFSIDSDTTLAITRGLGETMARARLLAWPEIMLLQLAHSTEAYLRVER